MNEKTEKIILEKMDELAKEINEKKWPRVGGLIIKKSYCCGAPVVLRGKGVLSYVCSQCGKPYREKIYS